MSDYNIHKSRPIELMPIRDEMFVHITADGIDKEWTQKIVGWARIESWNEDEDGYVENGSEQVTIEPLFPFGSSSALFWPTRLQDLKEARGEYWVIQFVRDGQGN